MNHKVMTIKLDRDNKVLVITTDGYGKTLKGDLILQRAMLLMQNFWDYKDEKE